MRQDDFWGQNDQKKTKKDQVLNKKTEEGKKQKNELRNKGCEEQKPV